MNPSLVLNWFVLFCFVESFSRCRKRSYSTIHRRSRLDQRLLQQKACALVSRLLERGASVQYSTAQYSIVFTGQTSIQYLDTDTDTDTERHRRSNTQRPCIVLLHDRIEKLPPRITYSSRKCWAQATQRNTTHSDAKTIAIAYSLRFACCPSLSTYLPTYFIRALYCTVQDRIVATFKVRYCTPYFYSGLDSERGPTIISSTGYPCCTAPRSILVNNPSTTTTTPKIIYYHCLRPFHFRRQSSLLSPTITLRSLGRVTASALHCTVLYNRQQHGRRVNSAKAGQGRHWC